ncbi:MAG: DMT family transporter [Candidatus Dormibacteria bacterium]
MRPAVSARFLVALVALGVGAVLPFQAGINAELRRTLGSPINAAVVSFAVGTVALGLVSLATRQAWTPLVALSSAPPWIWLGGICGAFYVASAIVLVPRIGAGSTVALSIAGQVLTSLVIDALGLVRLPVHPISALRLLGALLVVGGAVLVQRF